MLTTGSWVNETKPLNSGDSLVSQEMSYCLPTACPVLKVDVFSGFGQLLTFRKIYLRVLPSVVHSFLPCIYTLHFTLTKLNSGLEQTKHHHSFRVRSYNKTLFIATQSDNLSKPFDQ